MADSFDIASSEECATPPASTTATNPGSSTSGNFTYSFFKLHMITNKLAKAGDGSGHA